MYIELLKNLNHICNKKKDEYKTRAMENLVFMIFNVYNLFKKMENVCFTNRIKGFEENKNLIVINNFKTYRKFGA